MKILSNVWVGGFSARRIPVFLSVLLFAVQVFAAAKSPRLFPIDANGHHWIEFAADGFDVPVSGVVYRTGNAPCCGVPLGGISTGCIDIDPIGTFGFCSIFNGYPRQPKLCEPFLGMAIGDQTWVLAAKEVINGAHLKSCVERGRDPYYPARQNNSAFWDRTLLPIGRVKAPRETHYWGHYPIVDIEYETDSPVQVGLRAWAPFIPGDVRASDTPAAVFEVRLRNEGDTPQKGVLAMSFNGPLGDVKRNVYGARQVAVGSPPVFSRRSLVGRCVGNVVGYEGSAYVLGVLGPPEKVRVGGALSEATWSRIATALPTIKEDEHGSSIAVGFELAACKEKTIRFILAWHVPTWGERGITWRRMNAKVYPNIEDTVRFVAEEHESLLRRILKWQAVIYAAKDYPGWLKDCLVNSLGLIAEDGYYAQPTGPLAPWCSRDGLFGMIEAPRVCPQIECIPCSWYGNMPVVYFFPALARTTLEGYREFMRDDGAAPFCFGPQTDMWQADNNHAHENQIMLNGVCFVDMVCRMWQRTGDNRLLRHLYEAVKKSTTLTATMGEKPHPVIGFPPGDKQTEWWEGWPWTGVATHAAGMHLCNLLVAEKMAVAMGDAEFAQRCRSWFAEGSKDLEKTNWRDGSYLLFNKPEAGQQSDKVMSNQLDAEWASAFLGLGRGVFRPDRTQEVLRTIRRTCFHPLVGAVSFAARDGTQELTTYGIFPPETLILGMTYMYHGDRETGLEICRRSMENIVLRQGKEWDMPNMVNADTGEVRVGTDYYQMMVLWAVPAAIEGKSIAQFCAPRGLVDRILQAGADH